MLILKRYTVKFEIAGPLAMFTRVDGGAGTPVSYPVPTFSAAKGMFEGICRLQNALIMPVKVEICSDIRYESYSFNYGGPLRKSSQIKGGNNYQLHATVLSDVCYRLHGKVMKVKLEKRRFEALRKKAASLSENGAHAYMDIFNRRLRNGNTFSSLFLGWNEFVPSYVGPFRDETEVNTGINLVLPTMQHHVFSGPNVLNPTCYRDVEIERGVLLYD